MLTWSICFSVFCLSLIYMFVMCDELEIELLLLLWEIWSRFPHSRHGASKLSMQCFLRRTIYLAFYTRFLDYLYNTWTVVSLRRNLKTDCDEKYIFYYGNNIVFCYYVQLGFCSLFGWVCLVLFLEASVWAKESWKQQHQWNVKSIWTKYTVYLLIKNFSYFFTLNKFEQLLMPVSKFIHKTGTDINVM